ncbi:MAG: hypothetical protein UY13_C0001G0001 [Candidatus Pacebacteria bacterium GW2011_GWB1_47_8]|nr:MAG: hypothetical protein UY13_C0001G0001 [Candidatus Pacebacteria bacterium GW2011_GWB1_47_8]
MVSSSGFEINREQIVRTTLYHIILYFASKLLRRWEDLNLRYLSVWRFSKPLD